MAFVTLNALTEITTGTTVPGSSNRLQELTQAAPDQAAAYFSGEDIVRILNQVGIHSVKKYKAVFLGFKFQVWVGLKADGTVLTDVVALRCPPYYEPWFHPGQEFDPNELTGEFPNQGTLPPECT